MADDDHRHRLRPLLRHPLGHAAQPHRVRPHLCRRPRAAHDPHTRTSTACPPACCRFQTNSSIWLSQLVSSAQE